jgi:hypothetical protein
MMRILFLLWCVSGSVLQAGEPYTGPKEKLHVYLLIGQSNMAGRAPVGEEESGEIAGAYLLNAAGEWETTMNPLNRHSSVRKGLGMQKLNPGYSFARAMLETTEDISLGLVVNARGGSKIGQWAKGTKYYDEAVRRAREAQATGTLKGILWHQGESDSGSPEGYLEKLAELVKNLRADLGSPGLPFIAGQIRDSAAINEQIARLPDSVPGTAFVSSEGLKTMDRWHFDAESQKVLGERFAAKMQRLHAAAGDGR